MPLEPYKRGKTWWAKGRIEYNGRPITDYLRESTGSPTEQGARDWIVDREEAERRRHVFGEAAQELTFLDGVALYDPDPLTARYLIPILAELGDLPCSKITPEMVKALGPKLYPNNATDTWRRWVVTPTRSVINNAADLGRCPPIRIKGYEKKDRVAQDRRRGKRSRVAKTPGSWEWLLRFREHAPERLGVLAHLMFVTGRRIGQSIALHPDDLDRDGGKVMIRGAKGHEDEWVEVPEDLMAELVALTPKTPRGWNRKKANLRVFGYASSTGPLKAWRSACGKAGIAYLPPHSAGRHGFGQEMVVRQRVDAQATARFGAWADTDLLSKTYTHPEDVKGKIQEAFRTGRVQAEELTGLKLRKDKAEF